MSLTQRLKEGTLIATAGLALLSNGCQTMQKYVFHGPGQKPDNARTEESRPVTPIGSSNAPSDHAANADDANVGAGVLEVLSGFVGVRSPIGGLIVGAGANAVGREAIIEGQKAAAQINSYGNPAQNTILEGYLELNGREFGVTWLITCNKYRDLDEDKNVTLNEFLEIKKSFSRYEPIFVALKTERPFIYARVMVFDAQGKIVAETKDDSPEIRGMMGLELTPKEAGSPPGKYQAVFTAQVPKPKSIAHGPIGKLGVTYAIGAIPFEVREK